ncbi:BON domain-containing protein [Ochrobactrum sp. Marseille-Q0166]|uniref:BON domain-containing protein n=1 Tax=Ochrobactrum sp. Marseille-Q0166 TaxID=2761105 RepID=UPI00165585CE|nr:BON domain-containing protein [Ochrobactrum sp. Marseille-Q0166]MBC8717796.1 BON domain-containing protein [Ochrobactrum sp. Marseille-Q0166]
MLKWFWPALTWTAALTSLALWFGVDRVEADISERTALALSPYVWAGFDVDGRDVVLKGVAPDPEAQKAAVQAVGQLRGVGDFSDLTTVLAAVTPYVFKLSLTGEGVVLSGFIPDNAMREPIMSSAEALGTGILVDDQMALARGAQPEFEQRVLFAIDLARGLTDAEIEISEASLSVRGKAKDDQALEALNAKLRAPLPFGIALAHEEITKS